MQKLSSTATPPGWLQPETSPLLRLPTKIILPESAVYNKPTFSLPRLLVSLHRVHIPTYPSLCISVSLCLSFLPFLVTPDWFLESPQSSRQGTVPTSSKKEGRKNQGQFGSYKMFKKNYPGGKLEGEPRHFPRHQDKHIRHSPMLKHVSVTHFPPAEASPTS